VLHSQSIVLLILYIHDMIITGSDPVAIMSLKQHLQSEYEMKDLGFLRYFLGIKVAYSFRGYLLSQQKYSADLLDRATLSDLTISLSPLIPHQWNFISNSDAMMILHYHNLRGIDNW